MALYFVGKDMTVIIVIDLYGAIKPQGNRSAQWWTSNFIVIENNVKYWSVLAFSKKVSRNIRVCNGEFVTVSTTRTARHEFNFVIDALQATVDWCVERSDINEQLLFSKLLRFN